MILIVKESIPRCFIEEYKSELQKKIENATTPPGTPVYEPYDNPYLESSSSTEIYEPSPVCKKG